MSSETSTERRAEPGVFQATHFYLIAGMAAATVAVMLARNTHPVALLLLSAAVLAAGLVGFALHRSISGFLGLGDAAPPPSERAVDGLIREKGLILRSIKELEFDHAMGKVSDADFSDMGARLRMRALTLMQDIERGSQPAAAPKKKAASAAPPTAKCPSCQRANDVDARFCKHCGAKL